jgi:hypothetical protein
MKFVHAVLKGFGMRIGIAYRNSNAILNHGFDSHVPHILARIGLRSKFHNIFGSSVLVRGKKQDSQTIISRFQSQSYS